MSEPSGPSSASEPAAHQRRLPLWSRITLGVVALLAAGVAGGAIVAATRGSDHDVTSVVCAAPSVAQRGLPSVVTIHVRVGGSAAGSGSGEVIRTDGYILTNNHVISAAAHGGSISVLFSDGHSVDAHIVGRDIQTDLAVIKVETSETLTPIVWGDSSKLAIGQPVVALGAPLGLSSTVTSGIVSALDRSVNVPADNGRMALIVAAIQTDAAINPGNSGGALVDCSAHLVGIPTAGATVPNPQGGSTAGNIGIGFAIPANFARTISDELIANGSVTHSSMGIRVVPLSAANAPASGGQAGLFVVGTTPGGPAATAGLEEGDVITKLDGNTVTNIEQLQGLTLTKRPGETVQVTFERDQNVHTVDVTLGSQPSA
jgi:putative serine protease PepD